MDESFEVVYYSAPTPSSWRSLATLALVFDRIHFPGVYMGTEGLDQAETIREIDRIRSGLDLRRASIEDLQLLNCLLVASQYRYVSDFCVFPGRFGMCGTLEPDAEKLLMALEEQYFGPPPPGFHPTPSVGFAKGLPGSDKAGVNGPSWLCYPANAFLYAAQRGLAYLNDNPRMPVLVPPDFAAKNNAEMLSATLAMECVRLALPPVKELTAPDIQELRERTRDDVQPFRRAMLKFTKSVNDAIRSEPDADEVVRAAQFVVKTQVEPELEELHKKLKDPSRYWVKRLIDTAAPVTVLAVASPSSLPAKVVTVLAALLIPLGAEAIAQRTKAQEIKHSGLNFLLKLQGE